jgi:RNA polymerase sigma-70 factor, ECF subfamily
MQQCLCMAEIPRPAVTLVDDVVLLRRARRDPEAFAAFYERHAYPLWLWFRHCSGDAEVANDLVAESFAQALAGVARFRGRRPESAVAWLFAIGANLLAQWQRDRVVERKARLRLGMPTRAYAHFDEAAGIDDRLDAAAAGDQLRSAIEELPEPQRIALALRVLENRGYDEIAAALRLSEPTARQRVSRALRTLNARLKGVIA